MSNQTSPRRRLLGRLLVAALAVSLAIPAAASAARDPIAGGDADMHLKRGFQRKLANLGVGITPIGGAQVTGTKISVPIRDGRLDPTDASGYLDTGGGLKLSLGQRGVPITKLSVNTAKGAVFATVARARMQIGTFTPPEHSREGFGSRLKSGKLTLSENAANRISNRLGLRGQRRIHPGRVLSNVFAITRPQTVEVLAQGNAVLEGNLATLAKFGQKGVKVPQGIGAVAPATKPTPTSFAFPIAGGTIAPDAADGTVKTTGGVEIVKQAEPVSPTMRLLGIQLDLKTKAATVEIEILPTPPFPGAVGRSSIADVVLPAGSVSADPVKRTVTVKDAEARLQAVAASTLNDVFNQPAPTPPPASNFVVGDPLGTFSMTVQAR